MPGQRGALLRVRFTEGLGHTGDMYMDSNAEDQARVSLGANEAALAFFALGSYVQHRLEEGMPKNMLADFMQAYRVLWAQLESRELPASLEQQFPIVDVPQGTRERLCEVWPPWLSDGEKLRVIRHSSDTRPCRSALHVGT
jgi:hypothetical protein